MRVWQFSSIVHLSSCLETHINSSVCLYFEWFRQTQSYCCWRAMHMNAFRIWLKQSVAAYTYLTRYYREEHLLLPEASLIYLNLCIGCTCIYTYRYVFDTLCGIRISHLKIAANRLLTTTLPNWGTYMKVPHISNSLRILVLACCYFTGRCQ